VKRGLFKSKEGVKVNADANAAFNIIRKVVPTPHLGEGIEAVVLRPRLIVIR
jgi:putative transposase